MFVQWPVATEAEDFISIRKNLKNISSGTANKPVEKL